MANPELANYVEAARAQDFSDDAIRAALLKAGWAAADIEAALAPKPPAQTPTEPPAPQASGNRPIVDEDIESVSASTSHFFKRHPAYWIGPALAIVAADGLMAFFRVPGLSVYFYPFLLLAAVFAGVHGKIQHEFVQQFAAANGYSYAKSGSVDGLDGALFRLGGGHTATDVVSGSFLNCPISLFTFTYISGGLVRKQEAHQHTVFELQFDTAMPDILLENKVVAFTEPLHKQIKNHIALEGDFNRYFTLSVKKGFEVEALEVFTPDIMQELIPKAGLFSLEIVNSHLFIYSTVVVSTKKQIYALYDLAEFIVRRLGPVLARMKTALEAAAEVRAAAEAGA